MADMKRGRLNAEGRFRKAEEPSLRLAEPSPVPEMDEKRRRTCCFTGHRPAKLTAPEQEVRQWLEAEIDRAVADGYTDFITGCAMGVDIWAGQIVLRKREENPALRLIAASPWPETASKWNPVWKRQYEDLIRRADETVMVCGFYHAGVYRQRNIWMVERSSRLIACYNGAPGGTRFTVLYALNHGVDVAQYGFPPR